MRNAMDSKMSSADRLQDDRVDTAFKKKDPSNVLERLIFPSGLSMIAPIGIRSNQIPL